MPAQPPEPSVFDRSDRALVLVVEDDASNRTLLRALLEREGHLVMTANDGEAAIRAVGEHEPDVILLDIGLPRLDGLEVTRRLRLNPAFRTVPIILLTGRTDLEDMVAGLDAGADDFMPKPFRRPELLARIRASIRMRRAVLAMETAKSVVAALASAVEAKDATTELHCQRLASLAATLGERVGMPQSQLEALAYGALLHDVGKIGIPEAILSKTNGLTDEERIVLRRHPEIGERICLPLASARDFAPIVRHHHERWDGAGYPDGLSGVEIPLGARIVSLVDAYDAMTHDRPYRSAGSTALAIEELIRERGRQFDPELTVAFIGLVESSIVGPSSA
jgi:putative two-component system response regulator